jgi:hypothetical protein
MFDRHGTGVPVVRRKMPDVATLLLLMEDGKLAKLRWCRRFTFLRQEGRTCDNDPPAYADPLRVVRERWVNRPRYVKLQACNCWIVVLAYRIRTLSSRPRADKSLIAISGCF